ncbi:hypothetical protein BDV3_003314 [Batrachochytrium dendrobatidis]
MYWKSSNDLLLQLKRLPRLFIEYYYCQLLDQSPTVQKVMLSATISPGRSNPSPVPSTSSGTERDHCSVITGSKYKQSEPSTMYGKDMPPLPSLGMRPFHDPRHEQEKQRLLPTLMDEQLLSGQSLGSHGEDGLSDKMVAEIHPSIKTDEMVAGTLTPALSTVTTINMESPTLSDMTAVSLSMGSPASSMANMSSAVNHSCPLELASLVCSTAMSSSSSTLPRHGIHPTLAVGQSSIPASLPPLNQLIPICSDSSASFTPTTSTINMSTPTLAHIQSHPLPPCDSMDVDTTDPQSDLAIDVETAGNLDHASNLNHIKLNLVSSITNTVTLQSKPHIKFASSASHSSFDTGFASIAVDSVGVIAPSAEPTASDTASNHCESLVWSTGTNLPQSQSTVLPVHSSSSHPSVLASFESQVVHPSSHQTSVKTAPAFVNTRSPQLQLNTIVPDRESYLSNIDPFSKTVALSRKRKSCPTRAVNKDTLTPNDRLQQGIVKLDVYSMYLNNPRTLLSISIPPDYTPRLAVSLPSSRLASAATTSNYSRSSTQGSSKRSKSSQERVPGAPRTCHGGLGSSTSPLTILPTGAMGTFPIARRASTGGPSSGAKKSHASNGKHSSKENGSSKSKSSGPRGSFGGIIRSESMGAIPSGSTFVFPRSSSFTIPQAITQSGMPTSQGAGASKKPRQNRAGALGSGGGGDPSGIVVDETVLLKKNGRRIDMSIFNDTSKAPPVFWKKGGMLYIPDTTPGFSLLTPEEVAICSTLRILPDQYMHIKEVILTQVERRGPFKKRDAKSWFRIDVNKTAIIYDWFRALGWIPSDEVWERQFAVVKSRGDAIVVTSVPKTNHTSSSNYAASSGTIKYPGAYRPGGMVGAPSTSLSAIRQSQDSTLPFAMRNV